MTPPKLKVAAAGLGRMGKRHALNFLNRTPRAELVAAFTPDPAELQWAKLNLEPYGVTLYDDYEKMIHQPGLQAVVIGTATSVHAEEAIQAMEKNLHVLCEKPLSTNIEVCESVVHAAKRRPHLKVMCGFSRRFDESYRDAHKKVQQGLIGRPSILRSQTCDKHDPSGFFVAYAAWSGGVFVDMAVHDIDLTHYGSSGTMLSQSPSQPMALRLSSPTSKNTTTMTTPKTPLKSSEPKLSVNANPQQNFVNYYHLGGITREVPAHYYGRFKQAFVRESNEFVDACLDDTPLPLKLTNAVKAVQIGAYLQEALVSGKQIHFDEIGRRYEQARL